MFAKKANKVYRVDEESKDRYLKQGFDITDDEGKVIEHSPQATVPYSKYEAALKEIEELKAAKSDDKSAKKSGKKSDSKSSNESEGIELDPDA